MQLKGTSIRDKQSAGILKELCVSEIFQAETWALIFRERESSGNQLVVIQWMWWNIPPEASGVLSHSVLDQIQAAATEHLPHVTDVLLVAVVRVPVP